ncbi:MAG: cytochrome c3 family protein [Gallionella sp.]
MAKPTRFLLALFALMLISGCAQNQLAQKKDERNIECRSCHVPNGEEEARDFRSIYANPQSHHSVSISYPLGTNAYPDFNPPNGQGAGIAFFDRNNNGQPDSDEVQLFGTDVRVTVECATCHKAHGSLPLPEKMQPGFNLRVTNEGSALCIVCHRQ